jgi:tetratricopeptide (TPR) repeat protein
MKYNTSQLLNKAIHEFNSGNLFISKKILTDITNTQPNNFEALHILGSIYGIQNNHTSALSYFLKAYALEPNNLDLNINVANAYININDAMNALIHLNKMSSIHPHSEKVWFFMGNVFLRNGEYEKSIAIYDKAIALNPHSFQSWINKGCALNHLNKFQEAIDCFDFCLKSNPNIPEAWSNSGGSFAGLGMFIDARNRYQQAIKLRPNYFEAWCHYGLVLYELKQHTDALYAFDTSLSIEPKYPSTYFNKGKLLKAINRLEESLEFFNSAINLKPDYYEAFFEKGSTLSDLNKYSDAIGCFDLCLQFCPNYVNAFIKKAFSLSELGYFQEALDLLEKALLLNIQHQDLLTAQASVFFKLKKFDQALNSINQALLINPTFIDALSSKASILRSLHFYDEALNISDYALELDPYCVDLLYSKGLLLLEHKRVDESISLFEKVLALDFDYLKAYLSLAEVYLNKFEYIKGWDYYDKYRYKHSKYKKFKEDQDLVWNGEKNSNTLFIWAEQGLGDQVLISSVFKELELYPQKIIISLDNKLLPVYQRSFPNFIFLDRSNTLNKLKDASFDQHIPLGSILKFFRSSISDFEKASYPFIIDNSFLTNQFKSDNNMNGNLVCGLSWRSSNQDVGNFKSIPFQLLNPILDLNSINFINLQYKVGIPEFDADITPWLSKINIYENVDLYNDIDSLVSLIQACDVVVTCSNSTAHLAGALNKTTFLLLPYGAGKLWYWSEKNGRCLWYPSVSIFQQKVPGSWDEPILAIKERLVKLL